MTGIDLWNSRRVRLFGRSRGLHHSSLVAMKRVVIASAWLIGTTVPILFSAVFIFGCCVLPFHGVLHRMMPLCQIASAMLHGEHDDHHPAPPPPQKERVSGPSLISILTTKEVTATPTAFAVAHIQQSPASYRSFISLGALRCDQDVGLHRLLIETFRI